MKKLIMLFFTSLLFISGTSYSQTVTVKGLGTVKYSGYLGSGDKDKAYQKAQESALETYFSERGQADYEAFDANRDKIMGDIDSFTTGTVVLNEQDQSSMNKYSVSVRVSINETKLNVLMRKSSAVAKAPPGSKSKIVFIFVGREAASIRSFDARVVKRAEINATGTKSTSGTEGESITDSKISTNSSRTDNSSASVRSETGGSTTRKADDTSYRAFPLSDQRSNITSVFSQAGYKVIDSDMALSDKDVKAITKDFSTGNDLSQSTIRGIYQSLKAGGVPVFVLATLTLGAPTVDPSSGMARAGVRIAARALDVSDGSEISSVPSVNQFALGLTNDEARDKALKDGALAASKEVVSRLNAIGTK
jgi:hypothetical protein